MQTYHFRSNDKFCILKSEAPILCPQHHNQIAAMAVKRRATLIAIKSLNHYNVSYATAMPTGWAKLSDTTLHFCL